MRLVLGLILIVDGVIAIAEPAAVFVLATAGERRFALNRLRIAAIVSMPAAASVF